MTVCPSPCTPLAVFLEEALPQALREAAQASLVANPTGAAVLLRCCALVALPDRTLSIPTHRIPPKPLPRLHAWALAASQPSALPCIDWARASGRLAGRCGHCGHATSGLQMHAEWLPHFPCDMQASRELRRTLPRDFFEYMGIMHAKDQQPGDEEEEEEEEGKLLRAVECLVHV